MTHIHDVHADSGSVLPPDNAALTVTPDGEFGLLLPNLPPDAEVPRPIVLLVAMLARTSDEDWVEEMLEWFETQSRA